MISLRYIARPGDENSGHIFLYAIVIYDTLESQLCVASMLSESHNSNAIHYWLTEWIRLGGTVPDEFVSDMSPALLNAAIRAFAGLDNMKGYNETCFGILKVIFIIWCFKSSNIYSAFF